MRGRATDVRPTRRPSFHTHAGPPRIPDTAPIAGGATAGREMSQRATTPIPPAADAMTVGPPGCRIECEPLS
jgi:hypothetical protein